MVLPRAFFKIKEPHQTESLFSKNEMKSLNYLTALLNNLIVSVFICENLRPI